MLTKVLYALKTNKSLGFAVEVEFEDASVLLSGAPAANETKSGRTERRALIDIFSCDPECANKTETCCLAKKKGATLKSI